MLSEKQKLQKELFEQMVCELLALVGMENYPVTVEITKKRTHGGSFDYGGQMLKYLYNPDSWKDMHHNHFVGMSYIRRVFRTTMPKIVHAIYHEVGHCVDFNSNYTDIVKVFKKSQFRITMLSLFGTQEELNKYYRNLYHEKWADLYALDVWEMYGDKIIDILEDYEKYGLTNLFE